MTTFGTTGLTEHPSWHKWDSTKINSFEDCPRRTFYEYFLGWRSEQPSNHLHFGDCIHQGLAHLLENGMTDKAVEEAQQLFERKYRLMLSAETDELFYPKDVFNGRRALAEFPMEYPDYFDQNKLLYTEVAGSVPIDADRRLYLRMDAILQNKAQGYYFVDEHKTKGGDFNHIWSSEWELAFQVCTYTHALYCMYPIDQVRGVRINGIGFIKAQKTAGRVVFKQVPVWKTMKQMESWLWLANDRLDRVYYEIDRLEKCSPDDSLLYAFPMNDRCCTNYFTLCPYHEFCLAWGNPLQHAKQPPLGFKSEWWDPEEKEHRHHMELEWKK